MDSSDFFAFTALLIIFGGPCAVWLVSRMLAHRERMEMLRMGVVPPPNARDMRRAMKYGWTPGPTAPGPSNAYPYYPTDLAAQAQLRKGMQVAFIGLALLIGLGFIGYRGDGTFYPGPWLLGGLIPLFVGLAQVIGAVLSGATFGPPSVQHVLARLRAPHLRREPIREPSLPGAHLRWVASGTDPGDREASIAPRLPHLGSWDRPNEMPPVA